MAMHIFYWERTVWHVLVAVFVGVGCRSLSSRRDGQFEDCDFDVVAIMSAMGPCSKRTGSGEKALSFCRSYLGLLDRRSSRDVYADTCEDSS